MLYFHRRQKQLIRKIPHGFLIGKSLCDGNCLYNCLFGDETKAHALRLQSVLSPVRHFDLESQRNHQSLRMKRTKETTGEVGVSPNTLRERPHSKIARRANINYG